MKELNLKKEVLIAAAYFPVVGVLLLCYAVALVALLFLSPIWWLAEKRREKFRIKQYHEHI